MEKKKSIILLIIVLLIFIIYKNQTKAISLLEDENRNYIEVFNADGSMENILVSNNDVNLISSLSTEEFEEFETVKIIDSGKSDNNSIVLVFMGDGFTENEQDKFLEGVTYLTDNLFGNSSKNIQGVYPFNLFKEFVTVYAIKVISNESGVSRDSNTNNGVLVDNYFGSSFYNGSNYSSDERLLVISNSNRVDYYRNDNLGIILCNSDRRGATASGSYLTISMHNNNVNALAHELGHCIGKLGDEYYEPTGFFRGNEGYPNITSNNDINTVKWNYLIGYDGVLSNVSLKRVCPYNQYNGYYWFKPSNSCKMNSSNDEFCGVCSTTLIEKMQEIVNEEMFDYEILENDTIKINKYNYSITGKYDVLPVIDKKKVTIIGSHCYEGQILCTEINIPNSIEIIESKAFNNCVLLKKVYIPNSVNNLFDDAFNLCYSLDNLIREYKITLNESDFYNIYLPDYINGYIDVDCIDYVLDKNYLSINLSTGEHIIKIFTTNYENILNNELLTQCDLIELNTEYNVKNQINTGKSIFKINLSNSRFVNINILSKNTNNQELFNTFRIINENGELIEKVYGTESLGYLCNFTSNKLSGILLNDMNYYIEILNVELINSMIFSINEVSTTTFNLFNEYFDKDSNAMQVSPIYEYGDRTYKLVIKQAGKFNVEILGINSTINTKIFILKEELINDNIFYEVIDFYENIEYNYLYIEDLVLSDGTYYIGYTDLTSNVYSIDFFRKISDFGEEKLNVDTNEFVKCGSHISILEKDLSTKSYNQTYICKNFTRLIYLNQNLIQNISRLDYSWYSSDETVATVSSYGTVFAKNIGQVSIMGVLQSDPSKTYVKTFTIIDDSSVGEISVSNNYQFNFINDEYMHLLDITLINCPYPLIGLYNWTIQNNVDDINISFNKYGYLSVNKKGSFDLIGVYKNNTGISVIIHILII